MKKILITSAGTGTAFSYATAIAKNFSDLEIITADINPAQYVTASIYSKKHVVVPSSFDDNYRATLEKIITENQIDYYLPLIDLEIKNAYQSEYLTTKLVANNSYFCNAAIKKDCYSMGTPDIP